VLTDATAEIAIMLMLMVARRAGDGERALRTEKSIDWKPTQALGTQVIGKTLGLIGFGRIGQATAAIAHKGLGMKILYHSRRRIDKSVEDSLKAQYCTNMEDLLCNSDFVSLHCPGGAATENLINAHRLGQMKRTAFLINTSRGSVIDESALVNALQAGIIAGAGLDVYRNEPSIYPELLTAPNAVLMPHIGSATTETRYAMGMRAVNNLEQWLEGRDPPDRVT
jgi:lactate dehydrogenase-like 2-hydroxyacid dehydrogenase